MQDIKFTKFNNEIWEDKNIKGYEKLVLIYLISYNNETFGYSFPTRKQIEEGTGISLKTLDKTLDSLITKGYITKEEHISKNGRNNIYYIHKYLVASKDKQVESDNKPVEASTNELLIKEKCKLTKKLTKKDKAKLNELDADILIKAIDRANEFKESYFIGYLFSIYESIKKEASEPHREAQDNNTNNNSSSNRKDNRVATTKPLTKYHGTFNEHFRNYDYDELERKLLENQNKRRGLAQ